MRTLRYSIILSIICIVTVFLPSAFSKERPSAKPNRKPASVKRYTFSDIHKDAHIWSGMSIASNGKIFIGLCTHADAANLYEFDPRTEKMRHLANLTVLLGERGKGIWTNGKIHVRMEELDGFVYFGSFCEDNGPPAIDASSYNGPYWFRVDIESGKVEVLSKINSFWGLLGQAMDKKRRIIYGLAEDGHLYRYFIDDNYTDDMGRVDNWDICRTIFIDDLGDVYGSYPPGRVWKYDVSKDRIFDLEFLRLPITIDSRTMANPMFDRRAQWRYIEWAPFDNVAYGLIGGSNMLFKYDVHDGPEGTITPLTQLCAPQYIGGDPFKVPHATLAFTISHKEKKIYYIPVMSGDFDYGIVQLDLTTRSKFAKELKEKKLPSLSYMVTYDLTTGQRKDIGTLRSEDGRYVYGLGAAETDKDGKIWFAGAFEEPDEKYAINRKRKYPYRLGLGCYDPFQK